MSDQIKRMKKDCDVCGLEDKHLEQIVGGAEGTMSFEPGTLESEGFPSGISPSRISLDPGSPSKEPSTLTIPLQTLTTSSLPSPAEL